MVTGMFIMATMYILLFVVSMLLHLHSSMVMVMIVVLASHIFFL
jgi:hypothetical protein